MYESGMYQFGISHQIWLTEYALRQLRKSTSCKQFEQDNISH